MPLYATLLIAAALETTFVPLPPGKGVVVPHGENPHSLLYLDRCAGGCVIHPGQEDARLGQSSIIDDTAYIPEFRYGDDSWEAVVACVTAMYSDFGITVTDRFPGADVPHWRAVVAGRPGHAGFSSRIGGVAPFDCGVIVNATTFTFAEQWGNDAQRICEVIAQETAHAWGLDHQMLCKDPMTYLNGCGTKCFQNEWSPCGEAEDRECWCGGGQQNSWLMLRSAFGEGEGRVSSVHVRPVDDELVYRNFHAYVTPAVNCVERVEGWATQGELEVYMGSVSTSPYILDVPTADFVAGPVTLRIVATGEDVAETEVVVQYTDEDAPDAAPPPPPPPMPDGGPAVVDPPTDTAGCGCRAGDRTSGWLALVVVVVVVAARRDRAERRRR